MYSLESIKQEFVLFFHKLELATKLKEVIDQNTSTEKTRKIIINCIRKVVEETLDYKKSGQTHNQEWQAEFIKFEFKNRKMRIGYE